MLDALCDFPDVPEVAELVDALDSGSVEPSFQVKPSKAIESTILTPYVVSHKIVNIVNCTENRGYFQATVDQVLTKKHGRL